MAPAGPSSSSRPLVVLLHPAPRAAQVRDACLAAGHEALSLPAFALEPVSAQAARDAACALARHDWAIPVSPTAAGLLVDALGDRPWPAGCRAAAVGEGTASVLRTCLPADALVVPPPGTPPDACALLALPAMHTVHGARILVLRGVQGREALAAVLRERGARVTETALYARVASPWPEQAMQVLERAAQDRREAVFVLTSVDAVSRLVHTLPVSVLAWARRQPALAVHPRMETALRDGGWNTVARLPSGLSALLAALESASLRNGHDA